MPGLNSTTLKQLIKLNQDTFRYRIPALVFLGLMSALGILGNASVIYIYGFRLKQSNVHLFIALLAVSDIISCLICIPMEVYRLFVFYNYPSIASCKFSCFLTFVFYICSALMLLVISVERYIKVCFSLGIQVSRKMAKILAGSVFIVSLLLASPVAVFASPLPYKVDDGKLVQSCNCCIKDDEWSYFIAVFVFLVCVLVAMSTLYWRVMKTTRSHVQLSQQRRMRKSSFDAINERIKISKSVAETKMLNQTNRTVIWISAVYAASCIPTFIIAAFWESFTHNEPENPVNFFIFFAFQSWTINCALNPIVYGFLNSNFRTEFRTLLCRNLSRANMASVENCEESNQTASTATL